MQLPPINPEAAGKAAGWIKAAFSIAAFIVYAVFTYPPGFMAAIFWATELLLVRILVAALMFLCIAGFVYLLVMIVKTL